MVKIGCRPLIALEIDGVAAILDLMADGAGCAVLSRSAVVNSVNFSNYTLRAIRKPALRTQISLASSFSNVRPR